jgi:hypothetical protein
MNEDQDWDRLGDSWKEEPSTSVPVALPALEKVKKQSLQAAWRTRLILLTVCSVIAFITSLCVLRRSAMSYTFTVIAWSAFFSFGSYLLSTHESPGDLALETTAALARRSKKLERGTQLLDFARSLVGVETLICMGFWIVLRHREQQEIWFNATMIALGGSLLYGSLSLILAKTRRELSGLQSISTELHP